MRRAVIATALAAGALLVVVPRWVLPACEYRGFPRMHCSDTAAAEMAIGVVLLAVGALVAGTGSGPLAAAGAALSSALLVLAWLMPRIRGYCPTPKMPCHYGMVPAVRFIAGAAVLVLVPAAVMLMRSARRRGEAGAS